MFWNKLCFGGFPLKLYFSEWVCSPCGVISKIMLSLLWVEAIWEIKKEGGDLWQTPPDDNHFYRWNLQRFICSAHGHSSRGLGAAGKVLIFKGRSLLLLEVFQCFVDSSPAEENSKGTRELWSKSNSKDSPYYLQDTTAVPHRQHSGWIQSLESNICKAASCFVFVSFRNKLSLWHAHLLVF